MLRRDYLEAQIEEVGRLLAKILALITLTNLDEAALETKKSLDETGVDLEKLLELEVTEFENIVSNLPGFNPANIEALADVLSALGDRNQDKRLYAKSLALYQYVDRIERVFSLERNAKMNRVRNLS